MVDHAAVVYPQLDDFDPMLPDQNAIQVAGFCVSQSFANIGPFRRRPRITLSVLRRIVFVTHVTNLGIA